ncbi:S-adenosyl-L-methionine-dependent methyltransferase [Tothia fuscella]|uniref:S-adenosyl-L-methionine-dependent methyltransferase n=1 Tax=Tothia fuscella TaxID=1048955 RepID=A0A9P4NFI2_9PEZI|nr:S-adenosyl-L-methionine-dependent methyltransferase [Tothia fuscella]
MLAGTIWFTYTSFYFASAYNQLTRLPPDDFDEKSLDIAQIYDNTAQGFDDETDTIEYWWGIRKLRQKLVMQAKGHVLESAAGTGRNINYYDRSKIKTLLMADMSKGMLDICREKWAETHEKEIKAGRVRFWVGDLERPDVEEHIYPEISGKKLDDRFDTIVQSMGLCSTKDPEGLLRNLGKLVKDDGRILLLEHGKSHYDWLNRLLDQSALQHANRHGCWWNRDIGDIVQRSGLEIVKLKRHDLGTTWWVELKKKDEVKKPLTMAELRLRRKEQQMNKQWWEIWK